MIQKPENEGEMIESSEMQLAGTEQSPSKSPRKPKKLASFKMSGGSSPRRKASLPNEGQKSP